MDRMFSYRSELSISNQDNPNWDPKKNRPICQVLCNFKYEKLVPIWTIQSEMDGPNLSKTLFYSDPKVAIADSWRNTPNKGKRWIRSNMICISSTSGAEFSLLCYVAMSSTSELKTKLGNVVVISLHINWKKKRKEG